MEVCEGILCFGRGASVVIIVTGLIWVLLSAWGFVWLIGEERKCFWRLYCIYFLKLKLLGRICVTPLILVAVVVSVGVLIIYLLVGIILLISKTRRFLWDNEVQCKGYHCERSE